MCTCGEWKRPRRFRHCAPRTTRVVLSNSILQAVCLKTPAGRVAGTSMASACIRFRNGKTCGRYERRSMVRLWLSISRTRFHDCRISPIDESAAATTVDLSGDSRARLDGIHDKGRIAGLPASRTTVGNPSDPDSQRRVFKGTYRARMVAFAGRRTAHDVG